LSRSPHWVWGAIDPATKRLLAIEVGERILAMAQRFVHHVAQVQPPDCTPLFLTDGFRASMTALLTHYGPWGQPPRRQATGPRPKPRWLPLSQWLYVQVVKTTRRRRLGRRRRRVVFGTLEAVEQVLAASGWQSNTAFIERVNLNIRQEDGRAKERDGSVYERVRRGERGAENALRGLMTGRWAPLRRLKRGPMELSVASRYATTFDTFSPSGSAGNGWV
jgi:IS1 family transposase